MSSSDSIVAILDCNFLGYVAKSVFPRLTHEEKSVGVIFGFFRQLFGFAKEFNTNEFIFCWDSPRKTLLRRKIDPDYKRRVDLPAKTDAELAEDQLVYDQFDTLRVSILPQLGFKNIFRVDGFESDDLIAYFCMSEPGLTERRKVVISSDQDLWQLLGYCDIWNPIQKRMFTAKSFTAEYGIPPRDWILVKAIAGCLGDNVQGIPRIGEKTAIRYILGTLQNTSKAFKVMRDADSKELIERNLQLVRLPFKIPPSLKYRKEEGLYAKDWTTVMSYYGFASFLDSFGKWRENFRLILDQ